MGFQSVGDSDAMFGGDVYVLIDVPGRVYDRALPGLFRADHIGIVGQTVDPDGFNEHNVPLPLGWGLSLRSIVEVMGAIRTLGFRVPGDDDLAGLMYDGRGDCLAGFGAGAFDLASVAEQGREQDSSQDYSGGYRLGLEN